MYLSGMPRFLSSLLVMLLGASPARASNRSGGRTRRLLARALEGAAERAIEITVRPRSRARRPHVSWQGEVRLETAAEARVIPGTWTLEWEPQHTSHEREGHLPAATDHAAFAAQLTRLVTLREPGVQLRVGDTDAHGWRTLQLRVPTNPATVVEFDRQALRQILGDAEAHVELRVFG